MQKVAAISARIDPQLKRNVETIFEGLGLTASQAITLFYRQVQLQHGLPFEVKLPPQEESSSSPLASTRSQSSQVEEIQGQVDPLLRLLQENNGPAYWVPPTPDDLLMTQEEISYRLMLADLLAHDEGKFVAIHRGQVVDSDDDQLALVRRVSKNHANQVVLIKQVLRTPEPEIRIRSPRLVAPKT